MLYLFHEPQLDFQSSQDILQKNPFIGFSIGNSKQKAWQSRLCVCFGAPKPKAVSIEPGSHHSEQGNGTKK